MDTINTLHFFFGLAVGAVGILWFLSSNYEFVKSKSDEESETQVEVETEDSDENVVDEDFDDESGDNYDTYYVKFPHQERPIEIYLEERPAVDHFIFYRKQMYRVRDVVHKADGHTVYGVYESFN